MNTTKLRELLQELRVAESAYSLAGGTPNERYVLSSEPNGGWEVYYSEKGLKTSRKNFRSESDACEYLFKLLESDPTTRKSPNS